MTIYNRKAALIFRVLLVIGCFTGLYLNSGLTQGVFSFKAFVYYTIMSNLVCMIYFLVLTVQTAFDLKNKGCYGITALAPRLKGAFTMMITATFLIYHFILAPRAFTMDTGYAFWSASNLLVHYFTPFMVILDWLLFGPRGSFRILDPLRWLVIPFIYLVFVVIRAQVGEPITLLGSRYPYFFIDFDALGIGGVLPWIGIIAIFFVVLGYLIFVVDRITYKEGHFKFLSNPKMLNIKI